MRDDGDDEEGKYDDNDDTLEHRLKLLSLTFPSQRNSNEAEEEEEQEEEQRRK